MYKMYSITKERWIYVCSEYSFNEPDGYVELVKEYQLQLGGKVIAVTDDDIQHAISNDPLKLTFQWDSCFGITVVVPYETEAALAEKTVQQLCDRLNSKQISKES